MWWPHPGAGLAVVAVKGLGVTFYVCLLRPGPIRWDGKRIRLIYFSVNTSLCDMSSAISDTRTYSIFECARGKGIIAVHVMPAQVIWLRIMAVSL